MRGFKKYRDMKVYEQSGYKYKLTPMIILKGAWLREKRAGAKPRLQTAHSIAPETGSWEKS